MHPGRRQPEGEFPTNQRASLSLLASIVLLGSAACQSETKPPKEPTQTTAGTTAQTQFTASDTFGVLRALHTAEVEHGKLAQQKTKDPRVKAFAERVVADHKARMQKDEQLMSGLGIKPRGNVVSDQIKAAADQQTARLESMSGTDFDRAYLEEQINYYRAALDTFDKDLLPNARDPQIKADLTEARGRADSHLKEAQDLRLSLTGEP